MSKLICRKKYDRNRKRIRANAGGWTEQRKVIEQGAESLGRT